MGIHRKGSVEPISLAVISVALALVAGSVVEASETAAHSSDWSAIIEITKLLLWSFMLSLVFLLITLIGSALVLRPLDVDEMVDVILVDTVQDIGSTLDTLDRKLLAGYMSRDAHRRVQEFLEGKSRFSRRESIVRRKAA
jgi:hypothetical protein